MAAHDPHRVAKVVLFFYNEVYILTIMHTTTSGNTIATRALRCFPRHYRSSNKLTEEHFLRAYSAGLSLQEIEPVDITATHRGSACSPIRGEQGAYRESVCMCMREAVRREGGRERIWKFKGAWLFSCTSRSIPSEEYSVSSIYARGF